MREFQQLTTDVIHESPTNPRRSFTDAGLYYLTASLRRHGVLQPLLVRPNGDESMSEVRPDEPQASGDEHVGVAKVGGVGHR